MKKSLRIYMAKYRLLFIYFASLCLLNSCGHVNNGQITNFALTYERTNQKLDTVYTDKGKLYDAVSVCNTVYLDIPEKGKVVIDSITYLYSGQGDYDKKYFNDLTQKSEPPFNQVDTSANFNYGTLEKKIILLQDYVVGNRGGLLCKFHCYYLFNNNGTRVLIKETWGCLPNSTNSKTELQSRTCLYPRAVQSAKTNTKEPDGLYTKKMLFKNCGCEDYCASSFIDSAGYEYNWGNPSMNGINFDCNLSPDKTDRNIGMLFTVEYKKKGDQLVFKSIKNGKNAATQSNNSTSPAVTNNIAESSNTKDFKEIQLTLIDASINKAKIYLGEPDVVEYGFGHPSKGFMVYFNRVSNPSGRPKHLILFIRNNELLWANNAPIEAIYSVDDNQKACFGIHCLKVVNHKLYSNAANCTECAGTF